MRNASNVPHGVSKLQDGGLSGGGWVTGLDIANDGWMVCRNDTTPGHIRGPSDTKWREMFVPGVTYPNADATFKNPASRTYEVAIAPSNSSILFAHSGGFMWKSTDQAFTWTKQTGFKAGAIDVNVTAGGNTRLGGQHLRISPTNPLNVGFIHPIDGLYASTDGGTTWTLSASVTAPTGSAGGCIHFVSDTDVWIVTNGNLVRRSTTGVAGTFATVASGPSVCAAISSGAGNVYFVGDTTGADTQLFMWNGTVFSQPAGVTGFGVAVNPTTTSKIIVLTVGGGVWTSTNTGAAWSQTTIIYAKQCDDVPYLGRVSSAYLALGFCRFHPTLDRLFVTCGIGVLYIDSLPGTTATQYVSITKGIRQMLCQDVVISPNGTTMIPVQDKAGFVFSRANVLKQANNQIPDNTQTLRMGGGMDYARDNESYLAAVYTQGDVASLSANGGSTWAAMPTIPTFTHTSGGVIAFYAGNIAISNASNMIWVSSSNQGGGVSIGGVKYTLNGGTTWLNPTFGASVNMTGAMWHNTYTTRRRIVQAYKGTAGVFYLFCNGIDGSASAADLACLGMWKSTDGGVTFAKIRAGHFVTYSVDYYQSKLKLNNAAPGHAFWVQGATNNYPAAPYSGGLFFTNDDWVTTYSAVGALAGWSEPDDIALGAPAPGAAYPSLYVLGWRTAVFGLYACFDFNPSTRAGTWVLCEQWLNGKFDNDSAISADPTVFGRVVIGLASGGITVGDYTDVASAT